jgi:hypothetical protein
MHLFLENSELQAHLMTVQRRTVELQRVRVQMEQKMESKVSQMMGVGDNTVKKFAGSKESDNISITNPLASGVGKSDSSDQSNATGKASDVCDEEDLMAIIQQYRSMYADYGEYRKKEVKKLFHIFNM